MRMLRTLTLLASVAAAAWTPQEDALPAANRTWAERIADELDRSLSVYARPRSTNGVEDLVLRLLDDPERSVLILGRYVIVDQRLFTKPNKMHKGLLHLDFLRALLEKRPSQNVVYQWEWNADGFKSQDQLIRDGCPVCARRPRDTF